MSGKLTDAQTNWLRKAAAKHGLGAGSVANRTAQALARQGLARRYYDGRGLGCWLITDKGLAALPLPETEGG